MQGHFIDIYELGTSLLQHLKNKPQASLFAGQIYMDCRRGSRRI